MATVANIYYYNPKKNEVSWVEAPRGRESAYPAHVRKLTTPFGIEEARAVVEKWNGKLLIGEAQLSSR